MDKEKVLQILRENRDTLARFHVRSLFLFGSVLRGEAKPGSDIDFLVEFEPGAAVGLFEFIRLKRELSDLLGMEVDLGTPDALHPALKEDILKEAVHVA
jgi:predicted nucleotidyltransferase